MTREMIATVMMMAVKKTGTDNIEDIRTTVPRALNAPLYSYTDVRQKYVYDKTELEYPVTSVSVSTRPTYSTNTASRSANGGGTTKQSLNRRQLVSLLPLPPGALYAHLPSLLQMSL